MDILEKLFGGSARVKIMRLFLFNTEKNFDKSDIVKKAKVAQSSATKELNFLTKIKFIRKKSFFKADKKSGKKKRVQGYVLNSNFKYLIPLQRLLVDSVPMENREIIQRLSAAGRIKLVIVSGIFLQDSESRVDLLIVGDDLSKAKVKNAVLGMEAEIGRQLRYSFFDTNDFQYRMGMFDRLLRDIFDYPHEVVVDKIGLE